MPLMTMTSRTRWFALIVLCLGSLMIVLDTTIVNVALPSIRADLGFSQTSLAWVVNAYLLTFGGFLLLGGRLGDLYGHRKLFVSGIVLFTLASLACGLAGSVTVTAALLAAVYAIVNGNEAGWTSFQTLGLLGAAVVLLATFLVIETRAKHPLMPLSIFRHRTLATA